MCYEQVRRNRNFDTNLKLLPQLKAARVACAQLLRAAQKNNFALLQSDACPELYALREVVPEVEAFASYVFKKRYKHS